MVLTLGEEHHICSMLKNNTKKGRTMTQENLIKAVSIFVAGLTEERRRKSRLKICDLLGCSAERSRVTILYILHFEDLLKKRQNATGPKILLFPCIKCTKLSPLSRHDALIQLKSAILMNWILGRFN